MCRSTTKTQSDRRWAGAHRFDYLYRFGIYLSKPFSSACPLLVHFDWKKRLYVTFSLLLGVAYLQYTLVMLALTDALFLFAYLPGIVPFFSVSLISYCYMRIVYAVLLKLERQDDEPQKKRQTREAFYPKAR